MLAFKLGVSLLFRKQMATLNMKSGPYRSRLCNFGGAAPNESGAGDDFSPPAPISEFTT